MKKSYWVAALFLVGLGLIYFIFVNKFLGQKEEGVTQTAVLENVAEQQKPTAANEKSIAEVTKMEISKNNNYQVIKNYQVILKTTAGDITLELDAKKTPLTVDNFINLARKNFYNNTIFHRVINGFMIQGGDPNGDGTGGPGYTFADETFEGEYKRGVLAMANAGPNTNGSQFFILQSDYDLPKNYVIFGKVIKGIEVVDKIAEAPVVNNSFGEPSKPVNPVLIKSMEIIEE